MGSGISVIVFDCRFIRGIAHGDPDEMKAVRALASCGSDITCRMSDSGLLEFVLALLQDRAPWDGWRSRAQSVNEVLDTQEPIVPSGNELSGLVGLAGPEIPTDRPGGMVYYRALWKRVIEARSQEELQRPTYFRDDDGDCFKIPAMKETRLSIGLEKEREDWVEYLHGLEEKYEGATDGQEAILEGMRQDDPCTVTAYEDAARAIARFVHLYIDQDYNPDCESRSTDACDVLLLMKLALPEVWICTGDKRLQNHVRQAGAPGADRIRTPRELVQWLKGCG